jgi:hypothetical protein
MSEIYLDRHLIHNSSLACFLMTHFIGEHEAAGSSYPLDLPKLMLVLPLTWSETNREHLNKRTARSAIAAVLRETPILKVDLRQRVEAHTPCTLQGLNLAVSSRLIGKLSGQDGFGNFKILMEQWPRGVKKSIPPSMLQTVQRLAKWFSTESTENLYKLLFGIPNEIHD